MDPPASRTAVSTFFQRRADSISWFQVIVFVVVWYVSVGRVTCIFPPSNSMVAFAPVASANA